MLLYKRSLRIQIFISLQQEQISFLYSRHNTLQKQVFAVWQITENMLAHETFDLGHGAGGGHTFD